MFLDRFGSQFRNPALSASLAITLAAGAAGIFTVATSTSAQEVNHAAKADRTDRNMLKHDLSSLIFDARPIAGSKAVHQPEYIDPSRRTMTERILPGREPQKQRELLKGCESGLSPDIAPDVTVAPSRCVTERKMESKFASLR